MIQAVEKIEPLDGPTFAMIIMPAHHHILVRVWLFLESIIENQDRIFPFYLPYCSPGIQP